MTKVQATNTGRNHHRFISYTPFSDIVAFLLAFVIGWWLYPLALNGHTHRRLNLPPRLRPFFHSFDVYFQHAAMIAVVLFAILLLIYWVRNLYTGRRLLQSRNVFQHIIVSNVYAFCLFWPLVALTTGKFLPPGLPVLILLLNTGFCIAARTALNWLLPRVKQNPHFFKCPAIVIGDGLDADLIHEWLNHDCPKGVFAVSRIPATANSNIDTLIEQTAQELKTTGAGMIISAERNFSIQQLMRLLNASEQWRVPIKILSDEMNVIFYNAGLTVDMIRGVPLLHFDAFPVNPTYLRIKHIYSRVTAMVGLLILSPVFLTLALLIKLTSAGPVFFKQERIGANGDAFLMYKFRTMIADAEKHQAELESQNDAGDGLFKIKKDPRITPVGRLLRRFSLDELPQLINIAKGDMALVGPRPLPRRDLENYYEDWHYNRHAGLSGLTGLWQVSGRSDIDFSNMCILDIFYLRNQRLQLDIEILIRTATAVLAARGAY